ncbi:hypothetical protein HID58_017962 [Brassica napus]|uniref:Trichome birefringence-like C-terminal domain-containing protein n=1 Tax=Brassica napus TaxID=3708 RepID=A0ABQ8D8N9_BRANA|nr:hypothetical protein HID58_017962 [Brassica napus]
MGWINRNVDPSHTQVFFQGASPIHYYGREWNEPLNSCKGQAQLFMGQRYPGGLPLGWVVVNKVLSRIKKSVRIFLISHLGVSIGRTPKSLQWYIFPRPKGLDCSHWCLLTLGTCFFTS